MFSRREWLATAASALPALASMSPNDVVIDVHVHLFAGDPIRFPYSPLSYAPKPIPVERYLQFVGHTNIRHVVIVHPEPYQDDHRYLEFCFSQEPSKGFFKATCLFDPIDPKTPDRMKDLTRRNPGRIVAIRIHETHKPGTPSTRSGAIRDRDMRDPQMRKTWQAAHELGMGIQMHFLPHYAPQIGELAKQFPGMPVYLDHLARAGEGTPADFEDVLRLADLPRIYLKFSSVASSSKQKYPFLDIKPLVRRAYEAFGPDRIMSGYLGTTPEEFKAAEQLIDIQFDFAPESARQKIRGLTAQKIFAFGD